MAKTKFSPNELLKQARTHYDEAKAELDIRVTHKEQGFDEYDNLYRSWIDDAKWPFGAKIFIPQVFSTIYRKGSRLLTGKVKGNLVAANSGNELGARIGTELLSAQYNDHDFYFDEPLVAKWFRMDQNTRKYGAAFALTAWRFEKDKEGKVLFDGPTMEVLDNRKVFIQPGAASTDSADYVIVERETTWGDLERVIDVGENEIREYALKNLKDLEDAAESSDVYTYSESRNTFLRGLSGKSTGYGYDKKVRVLTEYKDDYWTMWCPDIGSRGQDDGLLLRTIKNPYKHGRKPIIRLVYIPIDDDVYGVSEIEPVRKQQKAMNALASGFVEAVSTGLYPIIHGHPTNVNWKTVEFKPRAAWIMNNPGQDVVSMQGNYAFVNQFVEAYRLLSATFADAMGETSADTSQTAMLQSDKTATEIKDLAMNRTSRDNLNKLFLAAAITKMYQYWWSMDQQFLTDDKVIRVSGKEALQYFIEEGMDGYTLSPEGFTYVNTFMKENPMLTFTEAYDALRTDGKLEQYAMPLYPVNQGQQILPKLIVSPDQKDGFLAVESEDMLGEYRFQVDINTIGASSPESEAAALNVFYKQAMESMPALQAAGYKLKGKELLEVIAEKMSIKNADQYFEKMDEQELAQMQMAQQQQQISPEQLMTQNVGLQQ